MLSFFKLRRRRAASEIPSLDIAESDKLQSRILLFDMLDDNLRLIGESLHEPSDLTIRRLELIGEDGSAVQAAVLFINGITDKAVVHECIVQPLLQTGIGSGKLDEIGKCLLTASSIKTVRELPALLDSLLGSHTVVMIDGEAAALAMQTEGSEHRQVASPQNEPSIRGPQDAFNEVLAVNVALLRRRIKDPNLVVRSVKIGSRSQTEIAVVYLHDTADPSVVNEVIRRLDKIKTEAILDAGQLEDGLKDNPYTPFPEMIYTERIDRTAATVFEGNVAVLVDGTPFVMLMPVTFWSLLFTAGDYYGNFITATITRWFRLLALTMALMMPSIYIALTSYHQEMVPTELMIIIAANRVNIPYPGFVEALIMEISFELLREASLRLPGGLGLTIGVVGALVIGQSAVQANLVGPTLVIVVGLTAIGSFAIPNLNTSIAIRFLRFPLMVLASTFGIFGIVFGVSLILIHLIRLKSFGVRYLTPATVPVHRLDDSILLRRRSFSLKHRLDHLWQHMGKRSRS